ncbi:MAG: hypothetical protein NTW00_08570 [Hyphomicrobiales bacterium]|nr:hypothetical protein [Hyphomicrobiales bacterium]
MTEPTSISMRRRRVDTSSGPALTITSASPGKRAPQMNMISGRPPGSCTRASVAVPDALDKVQRSCCSTLASATDTKAMSAAGASRPRRAGAASMDRVQVANAMPKPGERHLLNKERNIVLPPPIECSPRLQILPFRKCDLLRGW